MATVDGQLIWINNIVRPVAGDDGRVRRIQGLMLDVTQRKRLTAERDHLLEMAQAAQAEAEAAAERARFLAGASDLLASSLDQAATLDSLVRLAVPGFADWCVVHLAEPIGGRACTPPARIRTAPGWPRCSSGWPRRLSSRR